MDPPQTRILLAAPTFTTTNLALIGAANKFCRTLTRMTDAGATPALLMAMPSWLVTQVSGHAHRLLGAHLGEAGARGYHVRVLATLAEFGPVSQAELGRHAQMDRSDVTAAVGELAAGGLVERTPDAGDRRRNVVSVTDAGRARLRLLDGILGDVQDELLAPLSAGERATLAALLTRLLEHHGSPSVIASG
jgi:MarR family transcriptional regulator, lower aerobic nicotinate degradation pathway regulator